MARLGIFWIFFAMIFFNVAHATVANNNSKTKPHHKTVVHHKKNRQTHVVREAHTQGVPLSELAGYSNYPRSVKDLIEESLSMSKRQLNYQFGSSNPDNGGLDCSGAIYYLLNATNNMAPPRQANDLYKWVENEGNLHRVTSRDLSSPDFNKLKPGDLLFWSGTYKTRHTPAITHVMLYLGKNKENKPLMFGASGGGRQDGTRLSGVSVFDFQLPTGRGKAKFVGYGCIPDVTC